LAGKMFNRLSVKVFLISFVVQVLSGFLICAALYTRTPQMMYSPRDELDDLMEELEGSTHTKGNRLIDDFIRTTGIDLAFFDQATYLAGRSNKPLRGFGTLSIDNEEDYRKAFENIPEDKGAFGTYGVNFKDDPKDYLVQYFDYGKTENLIPRALHNSYPVMIVVVVGLSLATSAVYAWLFARPVRKLSEASRKMADMDFSVRCDDRRKDEIGDLARDLNSMSSSLDQKIKELENEITTVKELESQKEVFFAAASHELKTPVTVLEGHITGMLEGGEPYDDHDEYLSRSLRTVKQMESLINEILTASRMQSAKDVAMGEVDMGEVLSGKIEESEDLFLIRDITVDKDIEDGLMFNGNKDLTALAAGAFISNAVFYSKEGSSIAVSAHREGEAIVTSITNKDAHIDEKDLPHLFEPFYRTDASRSSRQEGSGLGLYLAKLIITKQGGEVSLENSGSDVIAKIILNSTQKTQ